MFESAIIHEWQTALVGALTSGDPAGLDDEGIVDAIRSLEDLGRTITAAQAQLALELDESQRPAPLPADLSIPTVDRRAREARHSHSVAGQIGFARYESPRRGRQHLSLARIARAELPHTWQAWREGRTSEHRVALIARETSCLSRADRLEVDAWLAADPGRFEHLGDRALAGAVAAGASRIDPESVTARRRNAESDRHVSLRPAPDTMTWFSALLPVKDGVAVYAALSRSADAARAEGDPRSRGQLMADTLVGRVAAPSGDHAATAVPPLSLNLVMTDRALLTGDDEPAHLAGFGPIPAELAREIVAGALSVDDELAIRRLYTDPTSGQLTAMDSVARTFRGNLATFIHLRDRVCRTPFCGAPIRHVDHVVAHRDGGPTNEINSQGMCEACNYAKDQPGWRARPGPDGEVVTTMPSGHAYRSRAPAVATIRRTPIRIDFVLAG